MINRRVQVYWLKTESWENIDMKDVRCGDLIRMFEPDGNPVVGQGEFEGKTTFVATSDAKLIEGVWGCEFGSG